MLGTGTPRPDPDRSGPSTAIVVNDVAYLVDLGPGIVWPASAAFLDTQETIDALRRLRRARSRGDHTGVAGCAARYILKVCGQVPHDDRAASWSGPTAKPRLLILYHYSSLSPEKLFDEMFYRYSGHFVIGRDLYVY